jgi:hypothetical protein
MTPGFFSIDATFLPPTGSTTVGQVVITDLIYLAGLSRPGRGWEWAEG